MSGAQSISTRRAYGVQRVCGASAINCCYTALISF